MKGTATKTILLALLGCSYGSLITQAVEISTADRVTNDMRGLKNLASLHLPTMQYRHTGPENLDFMRRIHGLQLYKANYDGIGKYILSCSDWMEFNYKVAELHRDYLAAKLFQEAQAAH